MAEIETRQQRRARERFFKTFAKSQLCCNCKHMGVITHHGEIVGVKCDHPEHPHHTAPNLKCNINKFMQR